jgi:gamma-glutamyltranspeptidase / glutathione hydrolase
LLAASLLLSGCDSVSGVGNALFGKSGPAEGQPGYVKGFLGGVAADEPRAALIARDVLSQGGNAADAAVALGFALSVTLPSRAGLGGGGACLVFARGEGAEAWSFLPRPPAHPGTADRPAAVPMLARGLYAMHAKYGNRTFTSLIAPAEKMARQGYIVARAFARDLAVVAGPLSADPGARAAFFPNGAPVAEGATMLQPALAATLAQIQQVGVGDLYQGELAHLLVEGATGSGLAIEDLRGALPSSGPPLTLRAGGDEVAFLPPPADGGLAAAAAFQVLQHDPAATAAVGARALAVAARFRQSGGDPKALLAAATLPAATLPPLPASTTFLTLDRRGNAVACALTMDNLFGTGRVAPGTGILLAASPAWQTPPLLAAAIAYSADSSPYFRAAVGGSGQQGAPLAAAVAMQEALADKGSTAHPLRTPVPEPGRANVIQCNDHLPGDSSACGWATDSRGAGLALGSTH